MDAYLPRDAVDLHPKRVTDRFKALAATAVLAITGAQAALPTGVEFEPFYDQSQFSFDQPTWVGGVPGHPEVVVVIQRDGAVYKLTETPQGTTKNLLLEVNANTSTHWDGAWAIAWHPQFNQNRLFYFLYRLSGGDTRSVVEEWKMGPDGISDPAKLRDIIFYKQERIHSSGDIKFGPDGFLYSAQADRTKYGQNMSVLAGKVSRIDIDNKDTEKEYAIPADNPFVANGSHRPEIWASGLRVPYRFGFDEETGNLFLGDVGNKSFEELNRIEKGKNYGAGSVEGPCSGGGCESFTNPLLAVEYTKLGCIIGGYVYRNDPTSDFYGVYIFADYEYAQLFGARFNEDQTEVVEYGNISETAPGEISSLGTDDLGRIYAAIYTERGSESERQTHVYRLGHPELKAVTAIASRRAQPAFAAMAHGPGSFYDSKGRRVDLNEQSFHKTAGRGLPGLLFYRAPNGTVEKAVDLGWLASQNMPGR